MINLPRVDGSYYFSYNFFIRPYTCSRFGFDRRIIFIFYFHLFDTSGHALIRYYILFTVRLFIFSKILFLYRTDIIFGLPSLAANQRRSIFLSPYIFLPLTAVPYLGRAGRTDFGRNEEGARAYRGCRLREGRPSNIIVRPPRLVITDESGLDFSLLRVDSHSPSSSHFLWPRSLHPHVSRLRDPPGH